MCSSALFAVRMMDSAVALGAGKINTKYLSLLIIVLLFPYHIYWLTLRIRYATRQTRQAVCNRGSSSSAGGWAFPCWRSSNLSEDRTGIINLDGFVALQRWDLVANRYPCCWSDTGTEWFLAPVRLRCVQRCIEQGAVWQRTGLSTLPSLNGGYPAIELIVFLLKMADFSSQSLLIIGAYNDNLFRFQQADRPSPASIFKCDAWTEGYWAFPARNRN